MGKNFHKFWGKDIFSNRGTTTDTKAKILGRPLNLTESGNRQGCSIESEAKIPLSLILKLIRYLIS
ncbi:hypothetical protein SCA6_020223 [Theobroma cacao]